MTTTTTNSMPTKTKINNNCKQQQQQETTTINNNNLTIPNNNNTNNISDSNNNNKATNMQPTTNATTTTTSAALVLAATTSTTPLSSSSSSSTTTTSLATSSSAAITTTSSNPQRAVTITPILNPAALQNAQNIQRTMQTDEDFNIRFVGLVRLHKCLYDKKVPEYRNRDNQEKAWVQISLETKESVIHCKERWRNLRACLSRYIKQQSGSDPQHKPYYLTEHMAFLLPFLKSTRNSLDGNNSFATLYQFSQQQLQQLSAVPSTGLQVLQMQAQSQNLEVKHSLSDNDDEETIDAFDPAVTASLNMQQQQHQNHNNRTSPALSDTASANTLQNFIPDVQLAELRTPEPAQDMSYASSHHHSHLHHHHAAAAATSHHLESHEFGHEPKRIKTECHEATTSGLQHSVYAGEQADMEFFRSILPDIASLTPQQKRKLKIGILELIDDVVERYPIEPSSRLSTNSTATATAASQQQSINSNKSRRNSSRDWRK